MALWVKVLGVQRTNHNTLTRIDINKIDIINSIDLVLEEHKKISRYIHNGIYYCNDHDFMDVLFSLFSKEVGLRSNIKPLFNKLCLDFAESSTNIIQISEEKILKWV